MKKALALVLALVLALSMAVSAFALDVITLKPAATTSATIINISDADYQLKQDEDYGTKFLVDAEGGVFYVTLDGNKEYKNIEVTANGIVDAKLVKYDPETMTGAETIYRVEKAGVAYDTKAEKEIAAELAEKASLQVVPTATYKLVEKDGTVFVFDKGSNKEINAYIKANGSIKGINAAFGWDEDAKLVEIKKVDTDSYEYNKAFAEALNDKYQTNKFTVDNYNKEYVYVIELTVAENYSAAYKTGSVKVTADVATDEVDRKGNTIYAPVSGTMTIVSDVAIFEYEMVKWAAKKAINVLEVGEAGYSDYLTALAGYGDEKYVEEALRGVDYKASVVSTTAFRAIEGKDLTVVANNVFEVTLKEVAAGQKGVNFAYYMDGEYTDANKNEAWDRYEENLTAIELGFYGDQVVKGKFEIAVDLGIDYYELRELFGLKVEEEDIITYYVLDANDNVVKIIKVDYMTDDISDNVEFTIAGENKALGQYSIVLEVPASETETEANPNTGAESVVGVVAALAVVSVATAAAVSLKK